MNDSSSARDLYEELGVPRSASKSEIKKAYHRAALSSHPDKVPEADRAEAEIRFKSVSQAYEILSDDNNRELYDQHGMAAFEKGAGGGPGAGMDMEDILAQMFGAGMGGMGGGMPGMGGARRRPKRGTDEEQNYEVTLEELYHGKTTRFANTKNVACSHCSGSGHKEGAHPKQCDTCKGAGLVQRLRQVGPGLVTQETVNCSTCSGSGQIIRDKDRCKRCKGARVVQQKKALELYIPPGSREGERIVLKGEADEFPGQEPGDIVFTLIEKPHDVFTRAGSDLAADLEITLVESLVGFDRVVLNHLDGRAIKLKAPKGRILRPEETLKVVGEGMPLKRSDQRGDLYLNVKIEFPEDGTLDAASQSKLREALPRPSSGPAPKGEIEEVDFEEGNPEDFGAGSDDPRAGAQWEDDDEDGPQAAQCAQQ